MSDELALLGGEPVRTAPFPAWPVYGQAEEEALARALNSSAWGLGGGEIARFEAAFAALHDARHGIAVTSGTVALRIALIAAGIEAGDEVLIPAYTFQATGTAVAEANAVPVYVDVSPDTYTMDPAATEAAVTPRTKAIIPVHFAGLPSEMAPLMVVAERYGLTVIEDAAQAHGARYRDRGVGSIGAMGCFSFQSSKNLNTGEGGMIVTNDDTLAERCRGIRNCGRVGDLTIAGNYRITEFQGAIGNAQMTRFEEQCATRERNARLLAELLADVPGIAPQAVPDSVSRHAYHLFSFRYNESVFGAPRSAFIKALNAEGIPATEGYTTPLYRQPIFACQAYGPYAGAASRRDPASFARNCPVTEKACASEGAWLYQKLLLGDEADMRDVTRAFEKVYRHRSRLTEVTL